jgi:hypothetical protein
LRQTSAKSWSVASPIPGTPSELMFEANTRIVTWPGGTARKTPSALFLTSATPPVVDQPFVPKTFPR